MPEDEAEAAASLAAAQTPCAGCRTLRRRCVAGCVFAPYFPADGGGDPSRFAAVHRVFGASNAARMLGDVAPPDDRRRAAETLVEEARARLRDPALGCLSYVTVLQMLNEKAREQVAAARAEIAAEFGAAAAAEAVDLASAPPAARAEAAAQAGRALQHAREQDAMLLAARRAADLEWWQQHRHAAKHAGVPGGRRKKNRDTNEQVAAETENTAAAAAGESSSEQTAVTPPAAAGKEMLAPAEKQEPEPATEAAREEALASEQGPATAPPLHDPDTSQLAGAGTSFLDRDQWAAAEALGKRLDTIIQRCAAAAGQQHHGAPAAARYASMMGLDVAPRRMEDAQEEAAPAAEAASDQDLMRMLAAAEQGMVMQLLGAAGAAQYGNLAAQYDDDVALVHGHQDMRQRMTVSAASGEVAGEQGMAVRNAAAAELAGQEMMQLEQAQYAQTEIDVTLGQAIVQQLAGAAKVAGEQDIMPLVATAEIAGEKEIFTQKVAAAELAREQQDMALLLQVAAALQDPVAQYTETELDISLGPHQPTVQEILHEQQLADAVGVAGEPNTTTVQPVAVYADGEHGSDSGGTVAFLPAGLGEAVPFLVQQRPPPQGQTGSALGLQMDSSLLPPPLPSLGQPHAQFSQQKSTHGGDEDQSSDLTAYLYY